MLNQDSSVQRHRFNRGFAIMLVLMMLFLLFMLGVAFFFSAWTHAFMARNYLNMKRAFVVAEGGVWHAIGRIIGDFAWTAHAQNKQVDWRWKYGEEPDVPVEYALRPSYAMDKTLMILGREVGLSGVMDPGGGAYGINSDIFHLKVNECSAQLYVNEGLGHPYNTAVMQRILNRLEEEIFGLEYGTGTLGNMIMDHRPRSGYKSKAELRTVLGDRLYEKVKDMLCVYTWSDPKVCNPVPLSNETSSVSAYDQELYQTRPGYPTNTITRYGRGKVNELGLVPYGYAFNYPPNDQPLTFGSTVYGWQELNPCWIEITCRAPVNINTAPRPVLVALLAELQGFFVLEQLRKATSTRYNIEYEIFRFFYPGGGGASGELQRRGGEIGVIFKTTPVSPDDAHKIADAIIARRKDRPFATWHDFNTFIDSLVGKLISDPRGADQLCYLKESGYLGPYEWKLYQYYAACAIADTIKANFNPNLHLNELNPDASLWQWVDKTDLIKNSTEFCFLPTGYFEIESVGRILRAEWEDGRFHISPYLMIMKDSFEHDNQIMGQRRLKVVAKLWDLCRQTVQSDFIRGSFSSNTSQYHTNLNLGCQTGPELNNGWAPFETSYEGYVSLSTFGGSIPQDHTWIPGKLYRTQDFKDEGIDTEECPVCGGTGKCPGCGGDGEEPCWCAQNNASIASCQGGWFSCTWIACGCNNTEVIECPGCKGSGDCTKCAGTGRRPKAYMHAHYDLDFWLHKSASGTYNPLTQAPPPSGAEGPSYWNPPDKTEEDRKAEYVSPYCLAYDPERYRICRAYSWPQRPAPQLISPTDQRVDGFYAERFAQLPYDPRGNIEPKDKGTISFWIKPGFQPEFNGYIKWFWSMNRGPLMETKFGQFFGWGYNEGEPMPSLPHWCMPTLHSMAFRMDKELRECPFGADCFCLGWGCSFFDCFGLCPYEKYGTRSLIDMWISYMTFICSPTLNHVWHTGGWWPGRGQVCMPENNLFLAHRWVHTTVSWGVFDVDRGFGPWFIFPHAAGTIYINGRRLTGTQEKYQIGSSTVFDLQHIFIPDFSVDGRSGKRLNPFWFGGKGWGRSPANSTLDELNVWDDAELYIRTLTEPCKYCDGTGFRKCFDMRCIMGWTGPCYAYKSTCGGNAQCQPDLRCKPCQECDRTGELEVQVYEVEPTEDAVWLWRRGRYYRQNDAVFTSGQIDLARLIKRVTAEPNRVKDPYGHERWRGDEGLTQDQTRVWLAQTWYEPCIKILGVTWTGYTQDVQDYRGTEHGDPAKWLNTQLELSLERKGEDGWLHLAGPWLNADSGWAPVMVQLPRNQPEIRCRVRFNTRCDPLNAILLETPILDDVTIYWMGRPEFLSWEEGY